MVGKIDLESMLDESGFGGATEMGGSTLDKIPEVSLESSTFKTYILTSLSSIIELSKIILKLWLPEYKATNDTATPAAISSDPVFCLFE